MNTRYGGIKKITVDGWDLKNFAGAQPIQRFDSEIVDSKIGSRKIASTVLIAILEFDRGSLALEFKMDETAYDMKRVISVKLNDNYI